MKLSQEQFDTLAQYEPYFKTAVFSNWSRHPGQVALQEIFNIYTSVTKDHRTLNGSCQSCVLHLIKDCGNLFFKEKQERIDLVNEKTAVDLTNQELEVKKVVVKTRKKKSA